MVDIPDINPLARILQPSEFKLSLPTSVTNPAEWMYERIVRSIINFEKQLDDSLEIGARLVSFTATDPIHIDDIGFWAPDLIIFHGTNLDRRPVQLLQHVTQVSVLLVALPKENERPRRIGFQLEDKLTTPREENT